MAAVDSINDDLEREVKKLLKVSDSEYYEIFSLFSTIKKSIEENYLSHLKTAIEDAINVKMKKEVVSQILSRKEEIGEDKCKEIEKMIKLNQFRPFTIILAPMIFPKKASTRIINRSALICFDSRIERRQLRVFLAHEFGHIVIKYLLGQGDVAKEQHLSNLFAFFAILDKDDFYKNDCRHLTHRTPEELLSVVANLTE